MCNICLCGNLTDRATGVHWHLQDSQNEFFPEALSHSSVQQMHWRSGLSLKSGDWGGIIFVSLLGTSGHLLYFAASHQHGHPSNISQGQNSSKKKASAWSLLPKKQNNSL